MRALSPSLPLRLGLGLTYLYSGIGLITEPTNWYGFAPGWVTDFVERFTTMDTFLRIQGCGELALALLTLAWFLKPKAAFVVAILGALHVASILAFAGIDPLTFRDIGLLGAWLAFAAISYRRGWSGGDHA